MMASCIRVPDFHSNLLFDFLTDFHLKLIIGQFFFLTLTNEVIKIILIVPFIAKIIKMMYIQFVGSIFLLMYIQFVDIH